MAKKRALSTKMTEDSLKKKLEGEKKKAAARKAEKDKVNKKKKLIEEIKKTKKA